MIESLNPEVVNRSERDEEVRLRPSSFDEYIGQRKVVENIEVMVKSAKMRTAAMDHVLLSGPPGLGKTSLAMLISQHLSTQIHMISGPAIEKKGDLAAILTNLGERDVLFIDEIHRMPIAIEEILYSAMEDFRLDILIGQGASARTMQIDIAPFTLIGATTRSGLLSSPLRDRFHAHLHFEFYSADDLVRILTNNAKKMLIKANPSALKEIAGRSRGTPRIANRILRRVRDFSLVNNRMEIEVGDVQRALEMMDIDQLGLDSLDRKILTTIRNYYSGGPVGIEALSATIGEDRQTIEDVHEPFLLKEGLIVRTQRGRMLSEKATNHLVQIGSNIDQT